MSHSDVPEAFLRWGYLQAQLDPLGRLRPQPHPELERTGEAADRGRAIYCGSIGVEFMHIPYPDRCRWIQERMESEAPPADRPRILEQLIRADTFERVLQTRYLGTKRYSLEGATALIPLLDEILEAASRQGADQVVLGMSHRGRLNVMAHIVGRRPADIFARFEDVDPRSVLGGGDVKYHIGATGEFTGRNGRRMRVSLVSNPSHLEAVDPVVLGRARAWQDRLGETGRARVLPITLHGDAAFAGQGIVAETLNLADLRGYSAGGTIHVIVNNLIGFTTTPRDLHSSRYSSDVARRLPIPIFHVNGEDPEAVVRAARLALEYRYAFWSDVVVDLIGYRLHGHSEVEDPTTTQPLLYEKIKNHPPLWKSFAGIIGEDPAAAEELAGRIRRELEQEQEQARRRKAPLRELPEYWSAFVGGPYDPAYEVETALAPARLLEIADRITTVPEGFHVHPKIKWGLEQRREMARGKRPVDWGMAEALAFGGLLREGTRVRLSGEDSRRGTFNQRHAVLLDVETEEEYCPLGHLRPGQGAFECYDSPLSEAAVLGFEFGYSRDFPEALVIWEAQFGDFANGAQVIIDQFVSATEDKWGLLSGLVMLLPHGYEGQGPEHSSARLERFLQLAGEDNLQIVYPSTSAQYFHLLRRQAMRRWRKPLVVFTPKSLLRDPRACSPVEEFTQGRFLTVIPDLRITAAERVLVCSGKIGHELRAERERRGAASTAIVLVEQLYPFPEQELAAELERHAAAREVVWVQEEPANMGALFFVRPRLRRLAGPRPLRSVKRSASASPATGSAKAHAIEQAALLELAFASAGAKSTPPRSKD
ncbi:MAG: 2-oxoglutarate dehydrogenase E1 component [Acidobacteria bacterium]|nr:2-oxoglutarate dehydrogenase E1 component [Acidobacteriota bacterium]